MIQGIVIEKKGKQSIEIPLEYSPKTIITTNYAIKGAGESHKRRRVDIALDDHNNATHTPIDEFGHMLFDAWDEYEWMNFDGFMLSCVQLFLNTGVERVSNENLIKKN